MVESQLKAPFPWFGGKSRAAHLIWQAIGYDVPNYVEPFAGSLATLLLRPEYDTVRHTETVNDLDCYLANFWRALQCEPDKVAMYADWPVNEVDLSARHQWLVDQAEFRERMAVDPDYFDPKVAGWWVWGICSWIGSEWCSEKKYRDLREDGDRGQGVNRQLPHLGNRGRGVNRQLPHLGNRGRGVLCDYFDTLSDRLRKVRVACGSWERVLGGALRIGTTGILLDPPYNLDMRSSVYGMETEVSRAVREWAIENGNNSKLRIVLCGYSDEHEMPKGWRSVPWHASKGYARGENENRSKETLFLSPHCLITENEEMKVQQGSLF